MRASDLRHAIDIFTEVITSDELGGAQMSQLIVVSLRGRRLTSREFERYGMGMFEGNLREMYETRYVEGITTSMKARIDGTERRIVGLEDPENGRHRRMHLTVEKKQGEVSS